MNDFKKITIEVIAQKIGGSANPLHIRWSYYVFILPENLFEYMFTDFRIFKMRTMDDDIAFLQGKLSGGDWMNITAGLPWSFVDQVAVHLVPKKRELTIGEQLEQQEVDELHSFWRSCREHDWTYSYSDDIRAWRAGSEHEKMLEEIAEKKGGYYAQSFKLWKDFNRDPGTVPKPCWFKFAYTRKD